jgi:hypothetical protein
VIFPVPSGSAIFLAFSFSSSVGSFSGLGSPIAFACSIKAAFKASCEIYPFLSASIFSKAFLSSASSYFRKFFAGRQDNEK